LEIFLEKREISSKEKLFTKAKTIHSFERAKVKRKKDNFEKTVVGKSTLTL
jgi:hypothetical protein